MGVLEQWLKLQVIPSKEEVKQGVKIKKGIKKLGLPFMDTFIDAKIILLQRNLSFGADIRAYSNITLKTSDSSEGKNIYNKWVIKSNSSIRVPTIYYLINHS